METAICLFVHLQMLALPRYFYPVAANSANIHSIYSKTPLFPPSHQQPKKNHRKTLKNGRSPKPPRLFLIELREDIDRGVFWCTAPWRFPSFLRRGHGGAARGIGTAGAPGRGRRGFPLTQISCGQRIDGKNCETELWGKNVEIVWILWMSFGMKPLLSNYQKNTGFGLHLNQCKQ